MMDVGPSQDTRNTILDMSAISRFPPELIHYIIDNFRSNKETLMSVSLISSAWSSRARYHLFRDLGIFGASRSYKSATTRFVDLCTDKHSTLPAAGARSVAFVCSEHVPEATSFLVDALLRENIAEKLFWNIDEMTLTCRSLSDWKHIVRLVRSGSFPQVRKLKMFWCFFGTESIAEMATIISSLDRLESFYLHKPWLDRFVPEASDTRFSITSFPKTLRQLTLIVHEHNRDTNMLPLFSECSTLKEITVDCQSAENVEDIRYFLEHTTANVRQMTLELGSSAYLCDDEESVVLLKGIIAAHTSRVEEVVIQGYMDLLGYMFSASARKSANVAENVKRIVLKPDTLIGQGYVDVFEDMVENDLFFRQLESITLQLVVRCSEEDMEEAGWDKETGDVKVESAPHREGKEKVEKALNLFSAKGRTKSLLHTLVRYQQIDP